MADQVPGVYTSFERDSDLSGTAENSRVLLPGLVAPGAPCTPNVPFLVTSLGQLQAQAGASWAQLCRNYKAARAQPASSGAEIWALPLADPGGTKATRLLKFAPQPTYDATAGWILGTAAATAAATECGIDVGGQVCGFTVPSGTSWADLATLANTALLSLGTELIYAPTVNSDTVTLTDKHGSSITDDVPIRVWFSNPGAGAAVILGTLTFANNATGAGSATLSDGVNTASDTLANNDTPATTAQGMRDSINTLTGYRAALANPATGVVTIYARDDRYARRLSATITAGIGTTATLAAGTAGTGAVSLTTALQNVGGQGKAFKVWALHEAGSTALGAVAAHLIAQDASPIEKGQIAICCISSALPGTSLIGATTPALSTTELMVVLHAQGATVPAAQLAARVAVEIASESDYGRNYNGLRILGNEAMPLQAPHEGDRSGRDSWNAAINQGYAPVAVDSGGRWYVVHARTTWGSASPSSQKQKKWSGALLPIYFRMDLRARLREVFFAPGRGKSLKQKGQPMTDRGTNAPGVKSEILALVRKWDRADYFDYGADIPASIRVTIDNNRVSAAMPFRAVADLDRMEIAGYPA